MFKRKFKGLNADVSILGFGGMRFPTKDGKIDTPRAIKMIDYAIENGVNYFDTAYFYHEGESERFFREALTSRYPRESYYLADKMPAWNIKDGVTPEDIFSDQLEKCGVEYFDFYLCHAMWSETFKVYKEYLLDFLIEKKKEGKIKRLGFSFHDVPENIIEFADYYDWDFVQIQLNYFDYKHQNAELLYNELTKRNIPVVIMEPVRGGALANVGSEVKEVFAKADNTKSVASWAIRYAMDFDNVMTVLSGMSDEEQVRDNVETAKNFKKLTKSEHKTIAKANEIFSRQFLVPCTKCRYCMDCPHGVDIPENFAYYNDFFVYGERDIFVERVNKLGKAGAKSCIKCNKCVEHCPQHIDIPKKLQEIVDKTKS